MQSRQPLFAGSILLTVGGDAVQPSATVDSMRPTIRYRVACSGVAAGALVYLFGLQAADASGVIPVAGTPGNGFPLLTGNGLELDLQPGAFYSIDSDDATAVVTLSPLV